jgi:hypothetical protein
MTDAPDTRFEVTFAVGADPASAWKALEELQPGRVDEHARPRRWWLPGFESTGSEIEAEPERRLSVRKDAWPCPDTLITITFEHVDTGSRIRVVQSGFDEAFVRDAGEGFWIAAEQIAADLRLFFETGILGGRHGRPWAFVGCDVDATPLGLEVTRVHGGTWAERVGLQPGDVLLTLAGAPLTTVRDLVTVQRVVGADTGLAATWARAGRRIEGAAAL